MRQVVLVVVLVGAAFLGGAFVNGPGLRWVQTQVLGSLGLDDGGEIATVDLKNGSNPERAGEKTATGQSALAPVLPVPGPVADPGPTRGPSDRRRIRPDDSGGAGASRSPALPAPAPLQSMPELSAPSDPPPVAAADVPLPRGRETRPPAPVAGPARATLDPDVTRAAAAQSSPAAPPPADRERQARPSPLDSLASLMPAPAPASPEGGTPAVPMPAPVPSPSPTPTSPSPNRPGDDDWATLARKMQAMGVSRFTIEGQPGGRVVFSCLIPLAGRQAVAQRFEAEGEDAPRAARAALRRVALWRAAQPQQSPQEPR